MELCYLVQSSKAKKPKQEMGQQAVSNTGESCFLLGFVKLNYDNRCSNILPRIEYISRSKRRTRAGQD